MSPKGVLDRDALLAARNSIDSLLKFAIPVPSHDEKDDGECLDISRFTYNNFQFDAVNSFLSSSNKTLTSYERIADALNDASMVIRTALNALDSAHMLFAKAVSDVSNDMLIVERSRGLASLPEDVLGLIFDALYAEDQTYAASFRLAVVCRRFRSVALRSASLWTHVNFESFVDQWEAIEALQTVIRRSGGAGLSTVVEFGHIQELRQAEGIPVKTIVNIIREAFRRSHTIHMTCIDRYKDRPPKGLVQYLYRLFGDLDWSFPCLRNFTAMGMEDLQVLRQILSCISATAQMIASMTLDLDGVNPLSTQLDIPCTVTNLELQLGNKQVHNNFDSLNVKALHHLLSSAKNVETLDLYVSPFLRGTAIGRGDETTSLKVILPKVSDLRLSIGRCPENCFTKDLFFPSLLSAHLDLWSDNFHIILEILEDFFSVTKRHPQLRKVSLIIVSNPDSQRHMFPGFFLEPMVAWCPVMEDLVIESNLIISSLLPLPPLRTLELFKCTFESVCDVFALADRLRKIGHTDSPGTSKFEQMILKNCQCDAEEPACFTCVCSKNCSWKFAEGLRVQLETKCRGSYCTHLDIGDVRKAHPPVWRIEHAIIT